MLGPQRPRPAGIGHDVDTNAAPASPVIVGVIQMALGYWHTCVRMSLSNGIRCWGDASNGALGTGNETVSLLSPPNQDVVIPTGDILAQVECGVFTTCVLNVTGGVKYVHARTRFPDPCARPSSRSIACMHLASHHQQVFCVPMVTDTHVIYGGRAQPIVSAC